MDHAAFRRTGRTEDPGTGKNPWVRSSAEREADRTKRVRTLRRVNRHDPLRCLSEMGESQVVDLHLAAAPVHVWRSEVIANIQVPGSMGGKYSRVFRNVPTSSGRRGQRRSVLAFLLRCDGLGGCSLSHGATGSASLHNSRRSCRASLSSRSSFRSRRRFTVDCHEADLRRSSGACASQLVVPTSSASRHCNREGLSYSCRPSFR
jgi:hypothetical protein